MASSLRYFELNLAGVDGTVVSWIGLVSPVPFQVVTLADFNLQTNPQRINSRTHVDWSSRNLCSESGGEQVVNALKKRSSVKHLLLGSNRLGDGGVEVIFNYLCSSEGRKLPLEEISLNNAQMGDAALDALSRYLENNQLLLGLHLPHNGLRGESGVTKRFVEAINSSRLRSLNLTYNTSLGDEFLAEFLPKLSSPHLRELKLSCTSLNPISGPVIVSYLSSDVCLPLRVLKLNANHLDLECLRELRKVMQQRNFSLTCLELFANHIEEGQEKEDHHLAVNTALKRNFDLSRCTRQEALKLLPISRCLLLESSQLPTPPRTPPLTVKLALPSRSNRQPANSIWTTTNNPSLTFPFRSLPKEIQLQILTNLCPTLSSAQAIRIFNYASDAKTLPSLKLGLAFPSSHKVSCISDPTATMMSGLSCSGDPKTCLGPGKTLICGREEKRNWWLELVGCERFEMPQGHGIPPTPYPPQVQPDSGARAIPPAR